MPCLVMHGGGRGRIHGGIFSTTLGAKSVSIQNHAIASKRPCLGASPTAKRGKAISASPQKSVSTGVAAAGAHSTSTKPSVSARETRKSHASVGSEFLAKGVRAARGSGVPAKGSGVLAKGVQAARRGVLSSVLRPSASPRAYGRIEHVDPGPVEETDAQHAARHPTRQPGCVRCVYASGRLQLERHYGSHLGEQDSGQRCRTVWLAPRPSRMGGDFAVGCIFCADLRRKLQDDASLARRRTLKLRAFAGRPRYANTKWARFAMSKAEQLAPRGLRQHADSQQHKLAVRAYFAPDVAVSSVEYAEIDGDRELFRGGVPQVEDWLRAWRACRTPQSFKAAEANGITENFIKGSRVPGANRKAFKAMARVMALVLRERKLRVLKKAKSCTLLFDDRKDFRIISYRCCTSEPMESWGSGVNKKSYVSTGRLAVFRRGGGFSQKQLSDLDDDYSRAMADSVVRAFERIATSPSTGTIDTDLVNQMCATVRIAVADGAISAQKCIKFLATGPMRNLLRAGRDRAHAMRIATSGPLLAETTFKAWWDDVFNDRHALVPDIQNSEEWSARLELCQKLLLSSDVQGSVSGHLQKVIKNFRFSKPRFDSMASPQLLYIVVMVAIGLLLAYVASDERADPKHRARASRRLEEMPRHVLTSGLSASYTAVAICFVRLFDTSEHDPALTYRQRCQFTELLRTTFIDGRIWDSVSGGDPTPLSLAWDTAREAKPIYYGVDGKVLNLFRKPSVEHAQTLSDGMQAVAESAIRRVDVEATLDDLGVLFTSFDLSRWFEAQTDMKDKQNDDKLRFLQRHVRAMFQSWRLDASSGVQQLTGMAFRLSTQEQEHLRVGSPRDNRQIWESVLSADFREPNDRVDTLLPMLEIYLGSADSTCGVERDLGALLRILEAHKGPIDEDGSTISYCTELLLDGPQNEDDIATLANHVLTPTDFTRDCVRMWTSLHGRRFRVYASDRKGHSKAGKKGTFAYLRKSVARGMGALFRKGKPSGDEDNTLIGLSRSAFVRPGGQENPAKSAILLKKFDGLTTRKQTISLKLAIARKSANVSGTNPYAAHEFNPNSRLRQGKGFSGVRLPSDGPPIRPGPGGRISTISCCREPAPGRDGYRVVALELQSSGVEILKSIKGAALVIMDSAWALDQVPHLSEKLLATYMAIIALGKAVVPRARWHECMRGGPPESITVCFKKVYDSADLLIALSDKFRREQPVLTSVVREIAQLPSSKWKLAASLEGRPGTCLDSRLDVRNFLLRERRVSHQRCGLLGGSYFRVARVA